MLHSNPPRKAAKTLWFHGDDESFGARLGVKYYGTRVAPAGEERVRLGGV